MRDYFIRRALLIIPTLLGVTLIVFMITRFLPGGPIDQARAAAAAVAVGGSGGGLGEEMSLDDDDLAQLEKLYGFDKPAPVAYVFWLGNVLRGNFGNSFSYQEPVTKLIAERLPISAYFGIVTLIITYVVSIPLGIYKAIRHQSSMDNVTSILVFVGYAVPGYVLGFLLIYLFSFKLNWLPEGEFVSADFEEKGFFGKIGDLASHTILPLSCYLISSFAFVTFLMKNHLLENLAADYVRTAVAKGVEFKDAVRRHALRNSLIPIATNLGHQVTVLIAGSFLIETIFDIEGFGLLGFESALARDYPVVMGVVTLSALLMMIGNILSDVFVAMVDPRIRFK